MKRRDYFKLIRAEAALAAFRLSLDLIRHKDRREAERRVLAKIAEKKQVVDEWKRLRGLERSATAEAEYRHANATLLEEDR